MPETDYCTLEHLQAILLDDKYCIPAANHAQIRVPNYPELAIKKMWPVLQAIPDIEMFLPDNWLPDMKRVDVKYVWKVAAFLDEVFVVKLLDECREKGPSERKRSSCPCRRSRSSRSGRSCWRRCRSLRVSA